MCAHCSQIGTLDGDYNYIKVKYDHISSFDLKSTALSQLYLPTGGLAQNVLASFAGDGRLGVAEDCGCLVASSTLDVHEV